MEKARAVMQVLDIKNDNIFNYIEIKITNFEAQTSKDGSQTCKWIWEQDRKFGEPGSPIAELQNRCGGIVRTLFNSEKDGSQQLYTEESSETYYFMLECVILIMSVAIATDYFYELLKNYTGDYWEALRVYISKASYANDVTKRVS